ncbi:SDR family oxidoreductase [Sunxiuqinia elliptica]|uniref:Short-subunit dehydrogenase n=1 Tax=Sunxiuqinia elliptica TaxID=655355 RepID=A0A4R6GPB5_9BACT|nr:SDR family oxidoreductase [Sunxiuqinia elliptica]TDN97109.1 short-subunit dehydrogenase [Sunxiuqinia elliptica]TDO60706.1 short-subunit dehydrogenase [Sunxiuqinia elliptica]
MKDKIVVITGASSGIGKALAYEFASRGASLVLAARRMDRLQQIEQELPGTEILSVQADVSKQEDCENLMKQAVDRFGQIDVLINNAGISMRALFADLDVSVMKRLMDVNFWGTVYCTKSALPHLLKTKGSVVGVISIAGYVGLPARTGYSASKYAIRGFLDALRIENLKTGLHVLVAAPGFTASEVREVALTQDGSAQGQTPRDESKMMTAEECAKHIANAVKKRKRELILTFVEGKLTVFLGKFLPRLLDKLTFNHMRKEPDSPFK